MKRITIILAGLVLFVGVGSAFHVFIFDFENQENPFLDDPGGENSAIVNEGVIGEYSWYVYDVNTSADGEINVTDSGAIQANNKWNYSTIWKYNSSVFGSSHTIQVEKASNGAKFATISCGVNDANCDFLSPSGSNLFDSSMTVDQGYWYLYNLSYNGSHVRLRAMNYSKPKSQRNTTWDYEQKENFGGVGLTAIGDAGEGRFTDIFRVQADATIQYGLCRAQHDNMGDIFTCFLLNVPYLFIVVGALISALVSFGLKRSSASLDTGYVCIGIGLAWVIFVWLIGFFEIYLVAITLLITGLIIFHKNL